MNGNPYKVLGADIATMLGRQRIYEQLVRQLTKPTPDHISVVGPRHSGKSVILKHLASQCENGFADYFSAAYWDLRHGMPDCDANFLAALAAILCQGLRSRNSNLTDILKPSTTTPVDDITLVLDELVQQKLRFLLIMDGFDRLLACLSITRNTWDTLRAFSQKRSFSLVIGSRQNLRELCRTEDSQTSDLWEVFNPNPLRIGHFEEHDWNGFLAPFIARNITIDASAKAEIVNWSGGVPLLSSALMQCAYDEFQDGAFVSKPDIDRIAVNLLERRHEAIAEVWDDCSTDFQSDLAELQRRDIPIGEMPLERRRELELRGLAKSVGGSMTKNCRLIGKYAEQKSSGLESLRRLFGDADRFSQNARGMLELRLHQIKTVDGDLYSIVTKAVRDLSEPADGIGWARRISNRAFELIWGKEAPGGEIPYAWLEDLKGAVKDRRIPGGGGGCRLLQLATGTDNNPRLTKYVTKRSYALLNFIHSVGDHAQHLRREEVTWAYGLCFGLSAIELCESLANDLGA